MIPLALGRVKEFCLDPSTGAGVLSPQPTADALVIIASAVIRRNLVRIRGSKMRGGDALVQALEKEGVEYISGFAGGGEVPLWPGLRASTSIKVFSARHERMGVEIADGYARATGKVGVALTGTGPGATNTLTGVAGAFADNVPVLLLMGQHPLGSMGKGDTTGSPLQHLRQPGQMEGDLRPY